MGRHLQRASADQRAGARPHLLRAGFALISQRNETLQRMYFQCDPGEDASTWSDDRIWSELQARVGGNGYTGWPEG